MPRHPSPQSSCRLTSILDHGAFFSFRGADAVVWPEVCQIHESFVSERHLKTELGDEREGSSSQSDDDEEDEENRDAAAAEEEENP